MWKSESIDISLIYKCQTDNIVSKCMPVGAHFVVAIHFYMEQVDGPDEPDEPDEPDGAGEISRWSR